MVGLVVVSHSDVLAQGVVGCLIAKMVPLSIVGDVLGHWFLFSVGVLAVVAISSLLGWLMTRWQVLPGTTALWGTSPGAASVMTIMAESYGADVRLPSRDVVSLQAQKVSLMPEQLLRDATAQQAADLLAFLQSLK